MSDIERTPWLHITSQFRWHGEAYITGTRDGLLALAGAINEALLNGDATAEVFATDGEGYGIVVRLSSTVGGLGRPVYFETLAREAFAWEAEQHERIIKDRRRKRSPSRLSSQGEG